MQKGQPEVRTLYGREGLRGFYAGAIPNGVRLVSKEVRLRLYGFTAEPRVLLAARPALRYQMLPRGLASLSSRYANICHTYPNFKHYY